MLKEEKEKGIIMAGGECEISIPEYDSENVVMHIVLYGKKSQDDKTWIKNEITQKLSVSEFENDLETKDKLEKIKDKTEKFKVTRPEKE